MSLPLRDLDDKDIELECGTVLRQGALVRHTFFGEAIARGVVPASCLRRACLSVCVCLLLCSTRYLSLSVCLSRCLSA